MTAHNGSGDGGVDLHRDLLRANATYADGFTGAAPKLPRRRLFVVTCMDARIDPPRLLGLEPGDAHIVRNAGGRVTDDVIRSLVLSSVLLGTRHAVVIHHTDCGLGGASDDQVRADLRGHGVDVGDMRMGAFGDLDDSVREDVAALSAHPLAGSTIAVWGYVYDVGDGRLRGVDST